MARAGDLIKANEYFSSIAMREQRVLNAPIEFYLGRVQEGLGNPERARMHYQRFVDWWRDSDPDLRPFWEEGRQALVRLQKDTDPPGHRLQNLRDACITDLQAINNDHDHGTCRQSACSRLCERVAPGTAWRINADRRHAILRCVPAERHLQRQPFPEVQRGG